MIAGPANIVTLPLAQYPVKRVRPDIAHKIATHRLDRPERKNPPTFKNEEGN